MFQLHADESYPSDDMISFCVESDCDYALFYDYYSKEHPRFCAERKYIMNSHEKRNTFNKILQKIKASKMSPSLVSIPIIESSLNIDAVAEKHPNSAAGLWQLKPDTARDMGIQVNNHDDQRFDPVASTKAGLSYINWLEERYDGNFNLAILAYHVGTGRVNRHIEKFGTDNPWFLAKLISEKNPDKNYLLKYYSYTMSLMGEMCE